MKPIARRLARWLDLLLGERCERCLLRVFPADLRLHEDTQHAGDPEALP